MRFVWIALVLALTVVPAGWFISTSSGIAGRSMVIVAGASPAPMVTMPRTPSGTARDFRTTASTGSR